MEYSIEYMQAFAKKRGGKCLSKEYVNPRSGAKILNLRFEYTSNESQLEHHPILLG